MKVVLSGPVKQRHLDDAELMAGIVPTSFVTNGMWPVPPTKLPVEVNPPCDKQPEETRELARNYSLCNYGTEAVICVGRNDHLINLARTYGLIIYESDR